MNGPTNRAQPPRKWSGFKLLLLLVLAVPATLVTSCVVSVVYGRSHAETVIAELRAECERRASLPTPPFVAGSSLLDLAPGSSSDFMNAAFALGESGFEFVEYQVGVPYAFNWSKVPGAAAKKFVRLHLAAQGDAHCQTFDSYVTEYGTRRREVQWAGVPSGMCIAAVVVDDSQADTVRTIDKSGPTGWKDYRYIAIHKYMDAKTGTPIATHWTAGYDSCPGPGSGHACIFDFIGARFSCGAEPKQLLRFDKRARARQRSDQPAIPRQSPVEKLPLAPFPEHLQVAAGTTQSESEYVSGRGRGDFDQTADGQVFLSAYAEMHDTYDRDADVPTYGLRVMLEGRRRIAPLADGDLRFFDCSRPIRNGKELAVTCQAWQRLNEPRGVRDRARLLVFSEDGTPKRHVTLDLDGVPTIKGKPFVVDAYELPSKGQSNGWIRLIASGTSDGKIPSRLIQLSLTYSPSEK